MMLDKRRVTQPIIISVGLSVLAKFWPHGLYKVLGFAAAYLWLVLIETK
jgi:hypothetical protein